MGTLGPLAAGILGEEEYGSGRMHVCALFTDSLGRDEASVQVAEEGWPCLALLGASSLRAEIVAETEMSEIFSCKPVKILKIFYFSKSIQKANKKSRRVVSKSPLKLQPFSQSITANKLCL